jgi:hypothetical protein
MKALKIILILMLSIPLLLASGVQKKIAISKENIVQSM